MAIAGFPGSWASCQIMSSQTLLKISWRAWVSFCRRAFLAASVIAAAGRSSSSVAARSERVEGMVRAPEGCYGRLLFALRERSLGVRLI